MNSLSLPPSKTNMGPISIITIPHADQRYKTVGDWFYEVRDGKETLVIKVSILPSWKYEFLVALHELVEAILCVFNGIGVDQIDAFDKAFEAARVEGNTDEPGDALESPYRPYHCIATGIERIVAALLGVCWKSYETAINSL